MDLKECEVCGDEKDVSRHYGVACCYGCKAFFRRTVSTKKNYQCKEGENCTITKANRNRCRFCRYKKCLQVGMSETGKKDQPPSNEPSTSSPHKGISSTSENLITFLKTMTKASMNSYDSSYDNLTWEECLKFPINRYVSVSDALKNPNLVVPKVKFDYRRIRPPDMAFAWYQTFVYTAEWAKGIPQFQMLKSQDQEDLFRLNFGNVAVSMTLYYMIGNYENVLQMLHQNDDFGNVDQFASSVMIDMSQNIGNVYDTQIVQPFMELNPDEEEVAIGTALLLFQFSNSLSPEAHAICKAYKEKLYTALYEWQLTKMGDTTELERIQRYTASLEMVHRVTKVWSEECEFHLMLSTFNKMNVDGLLKELLFNKQLIR